MENYVESITFNYQNDEISSVRVALGLEPDDMVSIPSKYLNELRKYYEISEEDKEIYFIVARAIQLKKENQKAIDGAVKKYSFGSKYEPFHELFISKLIDLSKQVPLEIIASNFGYEAKVEDLDIFLNRKSAYELARMMRAGILLGEYADTAANEDNDFE